MKIITLITAIFMVLPILKAQKTDQPEGKRSLSVGLNPINIYRQGQTRGALLKYYNKDQSNAWRLFPSFNTSYSSSSNNLINDIVIPDSIGLNKSKSNFIDLRMGFEKSLYSKSKFSSYGIIEFGINGRNFKSDRPRVSYRERQGFPGEGTLSVWDRKSETKSIQLNTILGIGVKYKIYKNFSFSLESTISAGPGYSKTENNNNDFRQYNVKDGVFTKTNSQDGQNFEQKSRSFSSNFNPITNIFFAFRF